MRYEDTGRTIVEYREAPLDPEPDPALKSVQFRRLDPPRPECELRGVNWWGGIGAAHDYAPFPNSLADPWFKNTGFTASSTLLGLVGYEWDYLDPSCNVPTPTVLFHWTGTPTNADAVRYGSPSGAIVFSAGSLRFSWGLDAFRTREPEPPADPRLQRFMRNALRDLVRRHRPTDQDRRQRWIESTTTRRANSQIRARTPSAWFPQNAVSLVSTPAPTLPPRPASCLRRGQLRCHLQARPSLASNA